MSVAFSNIQAHNTKKLLKMDRRTDFLYTQWPYHTE